MRRNLERCATSLAVVTMSAIALATGLQAQGGGAQAPQGPPPQRVAVTTTVVKPDMAATWRDLIRTEAVPAFKKSGLPWRWVFGSGPFGQAFTYLTVSPVANFAQYDQGPVLQKVMGPEGAAKYNAKVLPTVVGTHTVIHTLMANASLQSYSSTPPAWIRVATMQLLPGKAPEFASITAQEFVPAMKKAGVTDYWVFNTNYGAPVGQRTIVTTFSKFAELDGPNPLARALGQEAAQKLNQKRAATVASTEATVYRFMPELSYGVPVRPSTSTQQ